MMECAYSIVKDMQEIFNDHHQFLDPGELMIWAAGGFKDQKFGLPMKSF